LLWRGTGAVLSSKKAWLRSPGPPRVFDGALRMLNCSRSDSEIESGSQLSGY
jgi:hypothetical protein